MGSDPLIIKCPQCGVKNRVKAYVSGKVPVCQKCRTILVDKEEQNAYRRFEESLNQFSKLPDPGRD